MKNLPLVVHKDYLATRKSESWLITTSCGGSEQNNKAINTKQVWSRTPSNKTPYLLRKAWNWLECLKKRYKHSLIKKQKLNIIEITTFYKRCKVFRRKNDCVREWALVCKVTNLKVYSSYDNTHQILENSVSLNYLGKDRAHIVSETKAFLMTFWTFM